MGPLVKSLPVDRDVLLAATDGNEDVIKEIVSIYLRQGIKSVKKLRSAVKRDDPEQVAALAHRFWGSSRFFGADDIGKPLAALLKMGRSRHLSSKAPGLVDRTEQEFVRIDQFFKDRHE